MQWTASCSPDAPEWFQEFFDGVWDGDEFTVTAEQACWILETAEEAVRVDEEEDGGESGYREYFEIIFNVFDDFTNFQRMSAAENEE